MEKLLTPEEVKSLSTSEPTESEVNAVNQVLRSAGQSNLKEAFYYKKLSPQMKHKLEAAGYSVEDMNDRDGILIKIKIPE